MESKRVLDAIRVQLDQAGAALRRDSTTSPELQTLRATIEPLAEKLREEIARVEPRLDAARARLEQLGPKPKQGEPAEGADVARDRAGREAATAELDETARLGRALLLQADQQVAEISDRRRAAFNRSLFARSYSLLDPSLWTSTIAALPRDLRAARTVVTDVASRVEAWSTLPGLVMLGLAIGIAIALHFARGHLLPRVVRRDPQQVDVSRRRKLLTAFAVFLVETLPALIGTFAIYGALEAAELIPMRLEALATSIFTGIAGVVFLRGLAEALLAPGHGHWALIEMPEGPASRAKLFVTALASVAVIGEVASAFNGAIAAGLPLNVASRGVFAVLAALILAEWMRQLNRAKEIDEACLGPYVPSEPEAGGPARILGWIAVAAIIGSVLVGYVAFASFLIDQLLWLCVVAALLYFAIALSDEFVGQSLAGENRVSTMLQANTGLRRRSLEQLGVLASGAIRVVLAVAAVILVLVPWGFESDDIWSNLRSAFFGFKVGDVTISISTLFVAILFFGIAFGATRILQRWLDKTYLPTTELDAGLRNSITTAAGYVGFFVAAAVAFSYLGLSLDKIAIVAGALSVGIGFGLQSIVNNFVSGLILLWERPIRVGDLVVMGDAEGHVRKISVRATEIDTFDRATVIVPNSNLISGVVKNRVRGDRLGRIVIAISVPRDKDPARTAEILIEEATRLDGVTKEPPPRVFFKKISETTLDFELICVVSDVSLQAGLQSELNYAVFAALVQAAIIPMPGPSATTLSGLDPVRDGLEQIAKALAERGETGLGSALQERSEVPATRRRSAAR